MNQKIRITTLVENTVFKAGLVAEHGLSFGVEYGGRRIENYWHAVFGKGNHSETTTCLDGKPDRNLCWDYGKRCG